MYHPEDEKIVEDCVILETTIRLEYVISMRRVVQGEDESIDSWIVSTTKLEREFSVTGEENNEIPRIEKTSHVFPWKSYSEAIEDFNARVQYFANVIYKLPQG